MVKSPIRKKSPTITQIISQIYHSIGLAPNQEVFTALRRKTTTNKIFK